MSTNFLHLPCSSPRRAALACSIGLLLLFACFGSATAREHVTIKLDSIVCVEESDEIGSDDAYLVAIGVNLRTGRTRALSYGCLNSDSGDHFPVPNGQGIVFSDWIDHPSDMLVIVALCEFDAGGFNVGYIMQGGENGLGRGMANRVQQQLDPLAKQYAKFARPNAASPEIAVQGLRDKMRRIVEQSLGDDEFLGFYHIRMHSYGFWQNWATWDGARYQINLKRVPSANSNANNNNNGGIAFKSIVRFRVRDSRTKRPMPARVQLIQNGKMVIDRRASADGKFEVAVLPGNYRARFTMSEPHVSHHTLVKEVRVGKSDFYQDIYLEPIHNVNHIPTPPPNQAVNIAGTWRTTLFGQPVTYRVTQTGNNISWRQPLWSEAATGSVNGNQVSVTLHGPHAPTPPVVKGTVKTDASGMAVEIFWTTNNITWHR